MIGQHQLLEKIGKIIKNYPRFSIIVGPKGSGKTTIVNYICKTLKLPIVYFNTSIDEVREIISLSYEQIEPICYVCLNADNMSLGAKNSLLKITEEPPHNAYFILTLLDINNTLSTIQSRGTVLTLDPYNRQELIDYRLSKGYSSKYDNFIQDICSTTGEVDELFKYDIGKFYNIANTIATQIQVPKTGNIFKIASYIKNKNEDDGYDGVLLFNTVRNIFVKLAKQTKDIKYLYASQVTTNCIKDLSISNVNKIATVDNWVMEVRKVLWT